MALFRQRIGGIVQRAAHASTNIETPRYANHADSVQTVCVLNDFCLQALRGNGCGEAVGLDGMGGFGNVLRLPAQLFEHQGAFLCRHARSQMALWRVFFHCHTVMQQHSRTQDATVAAFLLADFAGVFPHAMQMCHVMRAIIGIERQRQQRLSQFLMGGERLQQGLRQR
ncbi:hypothetical protein D3C72_1373880 [compost metagenome]